MSNYNLAQYNLAYAHYRKRDYNNAVFRFRQYASTAGENSPKLVNDALLRVGDSYFITRDYKNAVDYYDKAIAVGAFEKDYAYFQSAQASGVIGDYQGKIGRLQKLIEEFPQSLYVDDAMYELGDVLLIKDKNDEALALFNQLIENKKESPYYGKAMLKSGLIYFNQEKDTLALDRFKVVVGNYRNTSESREAIDKIKKIYIDRGDLNGFETYMSGIGIADIPATSLDSAAYEIAENAYLNNNCDEAVKNFSVYLERYGEGLFTLNAHYYRGECELRNGFSEEALIDFEYVIEAPKSIFTEKALYNAARISRESGMNDKAISYYSSLEQKADLASNIDLSQYWLMKLYFEEDQAKKGLDYARKVLSKENLSDEIRDEASVMSGNAYLKMDEYNQSVCLVLFHQLEHQ